MICPFSEKACKECGAYRGRHYFLCYCEKYRGYVKPGTRGRQDFAWRNYDNLNIPLLKITSDPFEDSNLEKKYHYEEYVERKEAT
jgi:hypothetical protein